MSGERSQAAIGGDAEQAAEAGRRSAEIILIPKHLRMEWMDLMAHDTELPPMAYKVAGLIGSHFNRRSGDTYLSQETIAGVMGLSLRTVQAAIGELERRGYLQIGRRELGTRESDGRRVCGGRGVANTYAPALDGVQVTATNAGRRLAARVEEAWAERTQKAASLRRRKDAADCVQSEGERTQNPVGKDAADCVPTLSHPSDDNPPRARAGAKRDAPAHPLGYAAVLLERRLGESVMRTWFGDVVLIGAAGGVLTIAAPTAFNRDWLARNWASHVEACWNKANRDRPIERVEFVVIGGKR